MRPEMKKEKLKKEKKEKKPVPGDCGGGDENVGDGRFGEGKQAGPGPAVAAAAAIDAAGKRAREETVSADSWEVGGTDKTSRSTGVSTGRATGTEARRPTAMVRRGNHGRRRPSIRNPARPLAQEEAEVNREARGSTPIRPPPSMVSESSLLARARFVTLCCVAVETQPLPKYSCSAAQDSFHRHYRRFAQDQVRFRSLVYWLHRKSCCCCRMLHLPQMCRLQCSRACRRSLSSSAG